MLCMYICCEFCYGNNTNVQHITFYVQNSWQFTLYASTIHITERMRPTSKSSQSKTKRSESSTESSAHERFIYSASLLLPISCSRKASTTQWLQNKVNKKQIIKQRLLPLKSRVRKAWHQRTKSSHYCENGIRSIISN